MVGPKRYVYVLTPRPCDYYLAKDVIKLRILKGELITRYPSESQMQSHVLLKEINMEKTCV